MTYTTNGTTYTTENNTVSFSGTRGSGSFEGFDGISGSTCGFEDTCHAHFINELADKEEMTKAEQFESNILKCCNKVATMMYNESKRMNNGVSEVTKEECFNIAKRLTFKSYARVAGCGKEVDSLLENNN